MQSAMKSKISLEFGSFGRVIEAFVEQAVVKSSE